MSLISTHKGVHTWLKRNGYVGKKSNPGVVDKILIRYKAETGNTFHCWTFFPNKTYGTKWEKSRKEFNSLINWIKNTQQKQTP